MEILYAAAEMVPWIKVGGLADVAAALTRELAERGHHVRICLPFARSVRAHAEALAPEPVAELQVRCAERTESGRLWRAANPGSAAELFLIENDTYFDRPNPYVDPATGRDWPDNAYRFAFFGRAVLAACDALDWQPELIHLNDYQVAPIAFWLSAQGWGEGRHAALAQSATVLSIHNLGYQGIYPELQEGEPEVELARRARALAAELGIAERHVRPFGAFEFHRRINFMKAGLLAADLVTAVSPTYAREIQTPELGFGLDGVLRERGDRLVGILNGIDVEAWDPARDSLIPQPYGPSDFQGKRENKARLLEAMHLPAHPRLPLIGMISRLVDQKGFDLLARIADDLLPAGRLRMAVLGSGQPVYEQLCRDLAQRYPDHFSAAIDFNDPLAHLIEAGSDFFLMPSRYEPCGLNQMYSMRYGTVPIVRATGGLADTVSEFDAHTGRGSGFLFHDYEPEALRAAIERALAAYARPRAFKKLIVKLMNRDFSWAAAAAEYEAAYARARALRRERPAAGGAAAARPAP